MKMWSSAQKYIEVRVDTATKDLARQDKLSEVQFKADLGSLLIENKLEITVADLYLATGVISTDGSGIILPAAKK